jgi:hypothetical protein
VVDALSNAVFRRAEEAVSGEFCPLNDRALALWPRLDRRRLSRCACDPRRMVALISRRTSLPRESILALLLGTAVSRAEVDHWFG